MNFSVKDSQNSYFKKEKQHQRQIFKEMSSTFEKIDQVCINAQQSKLDKNNKKYQADKNKSKIRKTQNIRSASSSIFQIPKNSVLITKRAIRQNINKQEKDQSAQQNYLPKIEKKSIESQLKEIEYIHKNTEENKLIKYPKFFGAKQQKIMEKKKLKIIYNEQNICKNYWQQLKNQNKISDRSLQKLKEIKMDRFFNKNLEELTNQSSPQKFKSTMSIISNQFLITAARSPLKHLVNDLNTSICTSEQPSPKKNKPNHLQVMSPNFKFVQEVLQMQMINYIKQKNERKKRTFNIDQSCLEKENAYKIYSIIKGGYARDPTDPEGEYISLKKFNQDKQSFEILNQLYKKIKNNMNMTKIQNENLKDNSFRSLVCINELEGKISPSELSKLIGDSKIVK